METYGLHVYPGRLFVVEGVDGSEKAHKLHFNEQLKQKFLPLLPHG